MEGSGSEDISSQPLTKKQYRVDMDVDATGKSGGKNFWTMLFQQHKQVASKCVSSMCAHTRISETHFCPTVEVDRLVYTGFGWSHEIGFAAFGKASWIYLLLQHHPKKPKMTSLQHTTSTASCSQTAGREATCAS